MVYPYITLDGHKYAVQKGTYLRRWMRSFTSYLAANIVRLNFVDKGPGLKTYRMSLIIATWSTNSAVYQEGVTDDALTQMSNLETTYSKIATPVQFIDVFGQYNPDGVIVTDLQQSIPEWSTNEKPYIEVVIELTETTNQTINP